jgi:hypothetical protein
MTLCIAGGLRLGRLPDRSIQPVRVSSSERRSRLLAALATSDAPLSGDALAGRFGVSRQAIVHDVAILRAEGQPVVATVRGYLLARSADRLALRAVVAVRHRPDQAEIELLAIVDLGVRVVDVIVEHPTYGELRGELHLHAPADVRAWSEATRREGAHLLSELTGGVHLHTLEAATPEQLDRAREVLADLGFLLDER